MGARYYVPWMARWVAVDPLESKYTPQSPYVYCSNNPIGRVDETGMGDKEKLPNVTGSAPPGLVNSEITLSLPNVTGSAPPGLVSSEITLSLPQMVDNTYQDRGLSPENLSYIEAYQRWQNEPILAADIFATGHIGARKDVYAQLHQVRDKFNEGVANAILGGIFGGA